MSVPAAWVIIIGLSVVPSLYAWFNIVGFWNPYGNTQTIEVSVANEDTGARNDLMGTLALGDQIIATLKSNDQMGWKFTTKDAALHDVKAGDSYAAIVIPADFSTNVASIVSGDFTQPELDYYVNEKLSAIAPKVTDVGATTIDTQVNSTFVQTVSKVVASTLKTKLADMGGKLETAHGSIGASLQTARTKVSTAEDSLKDMAADIDASRAKVASASTTLTKTTALLKDAGAAATTGSDLLEKIAHGGSTFATSASATLGQATSLLSSTSSSVSSTVNGFSGKVLGVQGNLGGALTTASSIAESNGETVKNLTTLVNNSNLLDATTKQNLLDALSKLTEQNQANAALISDLTATNDDLGDTATTLNSTVTDLNSALQKTTSTTDSLRAQLTQKNMPTLTSGLSSLATTTGQLGSGLTSQTALVHQASTALTQLDTVLKNTATALTTAAGSLGDVSTDLGTVATDVSALGTSALWTNLLGLSGIDAHKISDFMASPTELEQKTVFPVSTYGSAMAPLFTNLSLWIGAFAMVVILKLEVDKEGIANLTSKQAYMGRWLLFAGFSVVQALIVTIGDLILGVQTVNPAAFILTGVLVSLAYLSIIFALSKSLAHVGKGICVLLVMLQIPGASGLYPIEMMPDFFRALYPLMPFTYGIDAMRETIGGFYDGHYAVALGKLSIFVALSFILGLTAHRYLANVNLLFADELDQTEIFVGEKAEAPARSYRLSQIIRALVDKDEYEQGILARARSFARSYPHMKQCALIVGFVVPVILAVISSLSSGNKALVLGLWVVWILLILGFLITIEYVRESLASQVSLGSMPESDIRQILKSKYAHSRRARGFLGRKGFADQSAPSTGLANPPDHPTDPAGLAALATPAAPATPDDSADSTKAEATK